MADMSGVSAAHDVVGGLIADVLKHTQAQESNTPVPEPTSGGVEKPAAKKARRPPGPTTKAAAKSLIKAAREGNLEAVQSLLARGVPANATDGETTALHQALRAPQHATDIMKCLLEHGADANVRNSVETTPLMSAALNNKPEQAALLLQHGAQPNLCNVRKQTVLMMATLEADGAMIEQLIKAGADVKQTGSNGEQALHHAVVNGNTEAVEVLLRAGADPQAKDNQGTTPLQLAQRLGRTKIYETLRAAADGSTTGTTTLQTE